MTIPRPEMKSFLKKYEIECARNLNWNQYFCSSIATLKFCVTNSLNESLLPLTFAILLVAR